MPISMTKTYLIYIELPSVPLVWNCLRSWFTSFCKLLNEVNPGGLLDFELYILFFIKLLCLIMSKGITS